MPSSLAARFRALAAIGLFACGPIGSSNAPEPGSDDTGTTPGIPGTDTAVGVDTSIPGDTASPGDTGTTPSPTAKDGYTTAGNGVFDTTGKRHVFHGLARPSTEWNWKGDHVSADDFAKIASWKANVVRIPLNQGFWLSDSSEYAAGYAATIDQAIQWARAAGLDVILDLHWSDRGKIGTTGTQQKMADARSVTMWQQVAAKYRGDGRVMFELYNEPHDIDWSTWQKGGDTGEGWTAVGMQTLYDAIRGAGADNVVFIGGLRYAFDLSGVPSHEIAGYNIVYATHPYNQGDKQPPSWDAAFGNLAATHPLVATEFGDTSGACGDGYSSQFIAYADSHQMGWTAWAWFPSGCTFPSLITDWNATPSAVGATVKAALGKY